MNSTQKAVVVIGGIAVGLAVVAVASRSGSSSIGAGGSIVYPGLEDAVGSAQTIRITRGSDELRLTKNSDGAWVLPDYASYPANIATIRPVVDGLIALEQVEPKTASAARHGALGLVAPEDEGTATRIEMLDGAGEALVDVLYGDADPTRPRDRGFIRLTGDDQTWLAERPAPPAPDYRQWVNSTVVTMPTGRIQSVSVDRSGEERYVVSRESVTDQIWQIAEPLSETGEQFPIAPQQGRGLARAIAFMPWTDVEPGPADFADPTIVEHVLFQGLIYRFEVDLATNRLTTSAVALEQAEQSEIDVIDAYNAQHEGWVYTVANTNLAALAPPLSQVSLAVEPVVDGFMDDSRFEMGPAPMPATFPEDDAEDTRSGG